jgi:hypothetical protein
MRFHGAARLLPPEVRAWKLERIAVGLSSAVHPQGMMLRRIIFRIPFREQRETAVTHGSPREATQMKKEYR